MAERIDTLVFEANSKLTFLGGVLSCGLKGIEDAIKLERLKVNTQFNERDPEGTFDQLESAGEQLDVQRQTMLSDLCSSIFLSAFSTYEACLLSLAKASLEVGGSGFQLKHFNGAGVEKAKQILGVSRFVDLSHSGADWEYVAGLRTLRNTIAHGGYLFENGPSPELEKFIVNHEGVQLVDIPTMEFGEIELTEDFVTRAMNRLDDLLYQIKPAEMTC